MSKTFDQGREEIAKLCRYFADNRRDFFALGVKEAHVRQSLIDPFFEALGWDMRNAAMTALQYREVIPEDSLEIEGQQKAPDYTFRVGTLAKFYTEAKKCGVNINADPGPAYQLRRYGWSAKVPLSILTDFEELGVYDCSLRPKPTDKASFGRIQYYRSEEYPDRWRELWDIFSREAVWAGAYDRYAASKRKRGTSEVDSEFLKEIEGWRDSLARNIALRNLYLGYDDLNTAVQRTIDRIIFLRMAEDRGSESYGQLLKLCEQPEIYARFIKLCRKADEKYNSGIFHFQKEDEVSEQPDRLTPALTIDDKIIKPILQSLYFENGSPYHFGVLPVEILGTVYERFLGKVIRLTADHRAKVEEKPEVRKAGGVYYTPAYIVDYIVKNTVGKMVEGKRPAQLAGGKNGQPLRVLDMACGSGSFLLGAYQCLLDHYLKWYLENRPEKHKEAVYFDGRRKFWRLTITEKKRILISHIFGVDIDLQAVEVSKLSLLLKVLEGETDETVGQSRQLFHERALPNLSNNIKCGNSLIGPDYFSGRLIPDPDEMKRVNPFDWNREFPEAMCSGGFDCVIGNPPYIRIQTMKEWAPLEVEIYKKLFNAASAGNYDIYVVFAEKGLSLLNKNGLLGYILPHKFFTAQYGEPLRTLVSKGNYLKKIVHFGHQQVFAGATTYTCLLFLRNAQNNSFHFTKVDDIDEWKIKGSSTDGEISSEGVGAADWNLVVGSEISLFEKMKAIDFNLKQIAHIFVGTQTSAEDIFVLQNCRIDGNNVIGNSIVDNRETAIEKDLIKWFLKGRHIRRYEPLNTDFALICPYEISETSFRLFSKDELSSKYPLAFEYLSKHKKFLTSREKEKFEGKDWWAFGYPKSMILFQKPKIVCPFYHITSAYAFDTNGYFFKTGYGILLKNTDLPNLYILGLLNSKLLFWYYQRICTVMRAGYSHYMTQYIEQLPIRTIDINNSVDKNYLDRMVGQVERMLDLHKHLQSTETDHDRTIYQRQVDATDNEIDQLVYELYGLTKDEIDVIEQN